MSVLALKQIRRLSISFNWTFSVRYLHILQIQFHSTLCTANSRMYTKVLCLHSSAMLYTLYNELDLITQLIKTRESQGLLFRQG